MTDFYALVLYRCLIAAAGALSIYLGYRLFFVVLERQGELLVKTGEKVELKMRNVAPGVFFALFGAVILAAASLMHPIENDKGPSGGGTADRTTERRQPGLSKPSPVAGEPAVSQQPEPTTQQQWRQRIIGESPHDPSRSP